MIKYIKVTNYLSQSIEIPLENPDPDAWFTITSIEGLGPAEGEINIHENASGDGSTFNSSRIENRNIVLTMKLPWALTIEEARRLTYKYFPVKKKVRFEVVTDTRACYTEGYVEKNSTDFFSSMTASQISIICPDPYFHASSEDEHLDFSYVDPSFEFVFSNESRVAPLLEFGSINQAEENVLYYDGDAETGITIEIHALGNASDVVLYNIGTREQMKLDTDKLEAMTGNGIIAGDTITIVTSTGKKRVTLLRNGVETNILNCLDRNSAWFTIVKGDNIFAYTAESGASNLQVRISHGVIYEGV